VREKLRDWLPAEAAERSAVRGPVEEVVAEWSSHWFARGELSLSGWALAPRPRPAGDAGWRDCGGGVEASCSSRASVRLAGMALDARLEQLDLNDRDRSLTSAFSRRMVDDLGQRLRRLLGVERDVPEVTATDRRVVATISDGADALLSLAIPFPLLIGLCRRVLPKPGPAMKISDPRLQALGPTTLRLDATLGSATLSLSEVRDLAVGDILLLDRTLGDAADLSLARSRTVVARGVLTETDGHVALILQPVE